MENSIINDNFVSSKDSDEICTMHKKSNNIEKFQKFFESIFQKYQERLDEK